MMRIKEAIQRRKLIQQLNDEYGEDRRIFIYEFYHLINF